MSSHHVVREKQEPALLILDLDNFSEEMLGQLLEWSPTVITTADTAEHINSLGIKIDIIIADEIADVLQTDVKLLVPVDSDPLSAALTFLVDNNYPAVNIISDGLNIGELTAYASRINIVLLRNSQKVFAIQTGFTKWKPAGERLSILNDAHDLQTSGFKRESSGDYITKADGFVTFTFSNAYLFIAEDI